MINGSDADFEKVDALFDKLAAASKDKQALLAVAQEILLLNQELKSKTAPAETNQASTSHVASSQENSEEHVEASSEPTSSETNTETTTEQNLESTDKVAE